MSSSPTPARRNSIVAVAVAEVAVIAVVAVIGGGAWLLGMVIGAILGAVATLTVVAGSDEVRPPSEAAAPAPDGVDAVTGLPTHDRLVADLQEAIDAGDDRVLTLYLFALDGFKDYNDAYGDACGDALLEWLARKLRDAVGSYGSVYRMRGQLRAARGRLRALHERAVRVCGECAR